MLDRQAGGRAGRRSGQMGARPSGVALSQDRRGVIVEADLDVRAVDRDLSIEPAWTHQGRVQNVRPIGACKHNDVAVG